MKRIKDETRIAGEFTCPECGQEATTISGFDSQLTCPEGHKFYPRTEDKQ